MRYRRVVVASNAHGRSLVVGDGPPPGTVHRRFIPGMSHAHVWSTGADSVLPFDGGDPTAVRDEALPGPGGTRATLLTIPPDSVFAAPDFDPEAAHAEALQVSPAVTARMQDSASGMHETPTIDYDAVLHGPVWLALDDGEVRLETGDVVVLHGARHAWRNHGDQPATVLAVLVGATATAGADGG